MFIEGVTEGQKKAILAIFDLIPPVPREVVSAVHEVQVPISEAGVGIVTFWQCAECQARSFLGEFDISHSPDCKEGT